MNNINFIGGLVDKKYGLIILNGELSLKYNKEEYYRENVEEYAERNKLKISLRLDWCDIEDVSMLSKVHKLYLYECKNIKDVSMLGNVQTLNFSGCKKNKRCEYVRECRYVIFK